jgi:hypothetical protein
MMMSRLHARRRHWLPVLLLVTLAILLLWPALGLAEDAEPAAEEPAAEAPTLDYTFAWPSFLLTLVLVLGYYVFIFRMSEKEFKGVVAERFGPKRN